MKKCKVIFRDEDLQQDIIVDCKLDEAGDLTYDVFFDPPARMDSPVGDLSGALCELFCNTLKGKE